VTQRIACADGAHRERAVSAALAAVRRGDLVVMPTESVYAVATDAFSRRGVAALRAAKGYDDDVPLPVMVGSRATVPGITARVPDAARALMDAFWPGPLTLLMTPAPSLAWDLPADAPVAIRMPLHPLALALLAQSGPLVVTTANLPGMPAPVTVDDAIDQLGEAVSLALDAGELVDDAGRPSTVVDVSGDAPTVVRIGELSVDRLRAVCPHVIAGDAASSA
jgi:L-threonylcarbamoyladenylate synthase